uniref:Uncharacterized protein n=1 Tax=viral metagenome TaxID=1070528 RepID=A0A6M3JGP9_9ZZZZ
MNKIVKGFLDQIEQGNNQYQFICGISHYIMELENKVKNLEEQKSRRNMQIRELKKKLEQYNESIDPNNHN